jgi:adhesin/invasin
MRNCTSPFGIRLQIPQATVAVVTLLALLGCGGEDIACGGPFCVVPPGRPEAAKLRAGSGGGQTGTPGRELPSPVEVLVTDADDRPIGDVEVGFTVDQGSGTLSASTVRTDHLGRAQVSWTLGAEAGTQSIRATATGSSGAHLDGSPLVIPAQSVPPSAAVLVLRQAPSATVQSGLPFIRQPVIGARDANDEPVSGVSVTVTIVTGDGTLNGTTTVSTDAAGAAVYTDLVLVGAIGPRTLGFSVADPLVETVDVSVEVIAGASSQVTGNEPLLYEGIVNSPVAPAPSVVVRDAAGNPVSGAVVAFTADRDGTVSPRSVTTDERGVAQVSSWTLGREAGTRYSLSALLQGSTGAPVLFSADARAGAAGGLKVITQPSRVARSGIVLTRQPAIQVVDKVGNPVAQQGLPMKATIFSGPPGTLQNDVVTTDASGRATFTSLTLSGLVGEYTLSFSAPGFVGNTANPISLAAGPASGFRVVTQVSPTARSRVPFSDQPVLQLQDDRGNPVSQSNVRVLAAIASGGGTLAGTTTVVTDANGVAAFGDLAIIGGPGARTLRLSSNAPAAEVITAPVTLPSVDRVSILTAPPEAVVVASQLTNPVSWTLEDAEGQPVADVPVVLSASPGNSVDPTNATSDENGIIRLQSWTVSQTAGEQIITLEVPDVGSNNLVIEAVAGPASELVMVSGDGQSAPVNSQLPEPLVVRVVDQFENGVGGALIQWRTCDGAGSYDAGTDGDGFSSAFQETGPEPGTYCVQATSAGLTGSPVQFSFTVTSGAGAATAARARSGSRPPAPMPAGASLRP